MNSAGVAGVYRLRFWSTVAKTQHTPTGARVLFRPVRHNYMASAEVKDSGWLKLFHPTPLMQRSNIASLHSFCFRRTLYRFNCNINRNFTQSLQLCRKFDQSLYSCYVHQSWQSSSLTSWTDFRKTHFLVCRFERCRCLTFTYKTLLKTAKQFPGVLRASGGKLFCTVCNIVVEDKRKLSLDKHFLRKTAS